MKTTEERMGQAVVKVAGSSPGYGVTTFPVSVITPTDLPKSIELSSLSSRFGFLFFSSFFTNVDNNMIEEFYHLIQVGSISDLSPVVN